MLKFPNLIEARFVSRPNRFLVRAEIDGRTTSVHLHDPGRLRELLVPGAKLYLQKAGNPVRKTRWDIMLVKKGKIYVAIYSILANRLAKHLFEKHTFPGFKSWKFVKSEAQFADSRFDFELARGSERLLVEIKSVSLVENGMAMFPDAPTTRGRRHLLELAEAVKEGYNAAVIFIVTRNDAKWFRPHTFRDPDFARTLIQVARQGVKVYCFKCGVTRSSIALQSRVPVQISPPQVGFGASLAEDRRARNPTC